MNIDMKTLRAGVSAVCLGGALVACGGGGSDKGGSGATPVSPVAPVSPVVPVAPVSPVAPVTPETPVTPVAPVQPAQQLIVNKIEFAQTHVIPSAGLTWTTRNDSQALHLVGGRDALALVVIGQADVQSPVLEAWKGATRLGTLPMTAPSGLPPTESGGTPYASDRWSATVPGAWLTGGVSFKVSAGNYAASADHAPLVGLDADVQLSILPFYLFGANDSNTQPFSVTKAPSVAQQNELFARWPVSKLRVETIGRVDWPSLVIPPRADSGGTAQPAYVITSMDQQKEGYAAMSATLGLLQKFRDANGDGPTNNQYYIPLLAIDTGSGKYHAPGGGLGTVGGGASVADYSFTGATIHEMGHAYGLNHAAGAYDDGAYPYLAGSLKGSVWGYDAFHKQFLNTLIPSDARSYAGCATSRQLDTGGRCYKQDPMQGGAGDQARSHTYTMFADFYAGKIQRWFEGVTTKDTGGKHVYSGGRIFVDRNSATGYSRWDSIAGARVPVSATTTTNKGLYGAVNQGLPIQTGVPVYAIAVTRSQAGTAGATQIYPPLSRTGNLVRVFDPANAQDLQAITPNTGTYPWYCVASGCDYTVRVTYADNSQILRVLEGGFRPWFQPAGAFPAAVSDAADNASFTAWVINVPAAKVIRKIELLDTPMVWNGMPASPAVLASR